MATLFSIIVPVYNSEKYLKKCIRSVTCQKFKNFEVVIINDCSNQKTRKIIKELRTKKNIRVINNARRLGVSKSRNLGLKNALGRYIVFLDSDDILSGNFLLKLSKFISKNRSDIIVVRNKDSYRKVIDKNFIFNKSKKIFCKNIFSEISNYNKFRATCWNYVVKREFLIKKNIFFKNIKVYEDQTFVANLLCSGKEFYLCDGPLYLRSIVDLNSLGKTVGVSIVNSCVLSIIEICNLIKNTESNKHRLKFLISRIKFLSEHMYFNLPLCTNTEIKNVHSILKKNYINFKILKKKDNYSSEFIQKILQNINNSKFLIFLKQRMIKNIKNIIDKKKQKKLFIFCAGAYAKSIVKIIEKLRINIEAVVDNNTSYHNKYFLKYKIKSAELFKTKKYKKSDIFISICNKEKKDFDFISKQLKTLKIEKNQIIQINI